MKMPKRKNKVSPESGVKPRLGWRLKQAMTLMEKNSTTFAAHIGLSQGSLSDIINNKTHPSANTLAKIYNLTPINIIWLLTDEGEEVR